MYPSKAEMRITGAVTKLGGQPTWLERPLWPTSAKLGEPMDFIGQFRLPGERIRLAYLFMSFDEAGELNTYDPEGGENALIIQRGGCLPSFVGKDAELFEGPSLLEWDEIAVELVPVYAGDSGGLSSWIGGEPRFIQNEEYPEGEGWRFLFQLDSSNPDFGVSFGDAGVGYGFVSADGRAGRFLWQCH